MTLPNEQLIDFYRKMLLIRRFEEKCAEAYTQQKIGGFCHLYIGQEATAVGALAAIKPGDYVFTAYRDHGHPLVMGSDPGKIMAELFGKSGGICKGKSGSMHLFDAERGFLGGHAIVGAHIPLAAGAAFAAKYRGEDKVTLCFFGEGAVNAGVFHEAFNMAVLWKLPVVFICENNRYGMGTPVERASAVYDIAQKGCAYDMARFHINGMDVMEVYTSMKKAVDVARNLGLPTFVEARVYRFMGHSMSDPSHGHYRTKDELENQKKQDPIAMLYRKLEKDGVMNEELKKQIDADIRKIVEDALAYAESSPEPGYETIEEDVYA